MKTVRSTPIVALSMLSWAIAAVVVIVVLSGRLYSLSPDMGHHGVLVSHLMDSWSVVPDANLDYMARYPRLAHLIASVPGSAADSSLIGMQVTAILAIFLCWACLSACFSGLGTRAAIRLPALLAIVVVLNAMSTRVETFGHEVVANYFFAHLVAQAMGFVLLAVSMRSEWKSGTPTRAYAVLAIGGPLLTAAHLVPAAEMIATLALLLLLNLPDEWQSRPGRRRFLVGLLALLLSGVLAVAQPAFGTMLWASANIGLTVLRYVPDTAHAIGVALLAATLSFALLISWWRRRGDSGRVAILMKYLGAFGLATSGLCLLQAVLLVTIGAGSSYAVLKYMICLQSLILVDIVVLATLFLKNNDTPLDSKWAAAIPPAFAAIATCAALLPNSGMATAPIVRAERDARAFVRTRAGIPPQSQDIAVGIPGVPNVGSYFISRSALRAWDEPMLFDLLIGKIPSNTEKISHVLTSSLSDPWDVPRCRRAQAGSLAVLDAACVFESLSELSCSGSIAFSSRVPLDFILVGFGAAESNGRWTERPEATMRCKRGDSSPRRMHIVTTALATAQHRQHVEFKINDGPAHAVDFSVDSAHQTISIDVPPAPGATLVLHIATPDAVSPESLGINADTRTLGVMVHEIHFE